MLDNNSQVQSFEFSINIEKPVAFYCNFLREMSLGLNPSSGLETLFTELFYEEIGLKFETDAVTGVLNYTLDDVAGRIATFYTLKIFGNLSALDITDVLLVYKPSRILFAYGSSSKERMKLVKNSLSSIINSFGLFPKISDQVRDENLRGLAVRILANAKFEQHFSSVVEIREREEVLLPFVPRELLNSDLFEQEPIENDDVWLNSQKFEKRFGIDIETTSDVYTLQLKAQDDETQKDFGILYNNFVFPLNYDAFGPLVKTDSLAEYYWLLFKNVFKKGTNSATGVTDELLNNFKEDIAKPELTKLLSFLKNNHYLAKNDINQDSEFLKYFEKVLQFSALKHIPDFEFFISENHGRTSLGIYTNKRIHDNYNLLHWIVDGPATKQTHFRNGGQPSLLSNVDAWALRPQIAFYFVTKYFEDFLERIIGEVTQEYISNFELFVNNSSLGELDFLIKVGNRLCFIEAKTKLTDEYIEKFLEKADRLIEELEYIDLKKEFYIISAYSDPSCQRKGYFINKGDRDGYNKPREGLNSLPYYFEVPIPRHQDRVLICISEPEADKLKEIINEICQK